MTKLVGVYGTLKQGFHNHGVMVRAGGEYLGSGQTTNLYLMVSLGGFPAVTLGQHLHHIKVEVYRVQDISPLDRLEGYPYFYDRTPVPVEMEDGTTETAYIYHIEDEEYLLRKTPVPGGEWV